MGEESMKTILFSDVEIGENFFDSYSGDTFIKVNDNQAKFTSGGEYFHNQIADFDPTEEVKMMESA